MKIKLLSLLFVFTFLKVHADCSASFIYNADSVGGYTLSFYSTSSSSNPIISWYWDYNDGSPIDSIQSPVHSFIQGTHNVCLTIIDSSGCTNTYCQSVLAGAQQCSAFLIYGLDTLNPLTIHFTDWSNGNATGWLWTFGDGDTAYTDTVNHTYSNAGWYNVCLTIFDSVTNCTDNYCTYVEVSNCYARFSQTASANVLTFSDVSLGSPTNWFWDFGDGDTSHLQNPVHSYTTVGWYNICLTISDSVTNCNSTDCRYTYAGETTCFIYFDFERDTLDPNTIYFFDQGWGSTPDIWTWSFGDGDTSYAVNPTHTFSGPGSYYVCCTITDTSGECNATDCFTLVIGDQSTCHANFNDSIITGSTVSFSDASFGTSATSYYWDFGIFGTSSDQNPYMDFQAPGTYYVCLTISDSATNCNNTYCDSVTIAADTTTGMQESALQNNFVIYPNPAKNILFIKNIVSGSENFDLKIFNPMGKLIEQRQVSGDLETIDFSTKAPGLYLVSLQNEKTLIQKKVMIIK